MWDELTAHEKGEPAASNASEAVRLVNDVEALRPLAAGDPEMENRVARSRRRRPGARRAWSTSRAARSPRRPRRRWRWPPRRASCAPSWSSPPAPSPTRRWSTWTCGCASCCAGRASRHIDAVIGKKKKLEIEIANLRQGRFPADLFATLQLEGLMGDDEEYWPFEGEYWSDEYENYK